MHSGRRLSEIIAAGPVATDQLLVVGAALTEIVAAAHANAKVFGALTTATVFVTDRGSVLMLDAAEAPVSARREDDLAALAAILYAMATGVSPFTTASNEPRQMGSSARPRSPIELNPSLPSGLVQLISRGVHPDAEQRFRSAGEIIAALREVRRAPGSLESLLPAEHVSSSAAVKPPPRPTADEEEGDDQELEIDDGEMETDDGQLEAGDVEDEDDRELDTDDRPRGLPFSG